MTCQMLVYGDKTACRIHFRWRDMSRRLPFPRQITNCANLGLDCES